MSLLKEQYWTSPFTSSYAKINEYGFIQTPYRKVVDGHLTDEVVYLTADEEEDFYISQATVNIDDDGKITDNIVAGNMGRKCLVSPDKVDYIRRISTTSSICYNKFDTFLEHDDATPCVNGCEHAKTGFTYLRQKLLM